MTFEPFTAYWQRCCDDLRVFDRDPISVAQWCYDHPPDVIHRRTAQEINELLAELRRNEPTLEKEEA
jgi:hypothetical protein